MFVLGSGVLFRPWQSIPLNGDGRISLIRPQRFVILKGSAFDS